MTTPTQSSMSISIVVIEVAGGQALAACLESIQRFSLDSVIAVLREDSPQLESRFRNVHFVHARESVPLRRKRGVELACTEVVVLIEDTTLPDASLLEGLAEVFAAECNVAASGSVRLARDLPARYQALACTEYGRYHERNIYPDTEPKLTIAERLPGNFICYRRSALMEVLASHDEGLVEGVINHQLRLKGANLVMSPKLANTYTAKDSWGARLATRMHHGWIYAGNEAANKRFPQRVLQLAKSFLLPVVLSLRAIRFMTKMQEIQSPAGVMLWICILEIFWSAGEIVGSVAGPPASMEHWR